MPVKFWQLIWFFPSYLITTVYIQWSKLIKVNCDSWDCDLKINNSIQGPEEIIFSLTATCRLSKALQFRIAIAKLIINNQRDYSDSFSITLV